MCFWELFAAMAFSDLGSITAAQGPEIPSCRSIDTAKATEDFRRDSVIKAMTTTIAQA